MRKQFEPKWNSLSLRSQSIIQFGVFLAALLTLTIILYWRYIIGERCLVFIEIGSDSYAQSVPFFLNSAYRIAEHDFSFWNFSQSLGMSYPQIYGIEYIVSLFGRDNVATMMLVSQMIKVVLAGVFFYLFLCYWEFRYATRFTASMGIALCGRMLGLCAWTAYTLEVVLAAALLWSFERFYKDQRHFLALPIVFAMIIALLSLYGTVLYSCTLFGYAVFRMLYDDRFASSRSRVAFLLKLLSLCCMAVLLSAPLLLSYFKSYINSSRVVSTISGAEIPWNEVTSLPILSEEIVKTFSAGILGSMDSYSGTLNILNSPYYYCGILPLIGIPFAFAGKNSRQRVALGMLLFFVAVYYVSNGFRYALNGFAIGANDFRMSSLPITLVLSLLGAIGLERLWDDAKWPEMIIWVAVLESLFLSASFVLGQEIHPKYVLMADTLIIVYCFAICVSAHGQRRWILALVMACCCMELLLGGYALVNRVPTITPSDYEAAFDGALHSLLDEVDGDSVGAYRVDNKTLLLAAPMAEDYLGTQAYIGGTGLPDSQSRFLKELDNDYLDQLGYSRYMYGFNNRATNALLGVRYLIRPARQGEDCYVPFGYHKVYEESGSQYRIYENEYALPLFYGYPKSDTISESALRQVDRSERAQQMLETLVVPDGMDAGGSSARTGNGDSLSPIFVSKNSATLDVPMQGVFDTPTADISTLLVKMDLNARAIESGDVSIDVRLESSSTGATLEVPYFTAAGNEEIVIPVENRGYDSIDVAITSVNLCDSATVDGFTVYAASSEIDDEYRKACEDRMEGDPAIHYFSSGIIDGTISMDSEGYLATSVPYDHYWHVLIDGEEVDSIRVNLGFLGAEIGAGSHHVQLRYVDEARTVGIVLCCLSCAALLIVKAAVHRRTVRYRVRENAAIDESTEAR